ncbi:MAG TPA: hypothetical protein VEQ60_12375 [Longimicrobium sp.]|nr:hypothetical protein [Longimicrobium sp.]
MIASAPSTLRTTASDASSQTVPQCFDAVLQSLSIEASRAKASKQQQALRDNLSSHLAVLMSLLTGSYRRGTQIPPLDDIDVLLVLDLEEYAAYHVNTVEATRSVLVMVRTALRAAYPHSEIETFDRCVRIQFTGTGIGFDVTPAFQLAEDIFSIPDKAQGRWILTNPKEHQRQISRANQDVCDCQLIPLVKLLKAWNLEQGHVLSGFHLEVMAYRALTFAPANFREGLAYLFEQLVTAVKSRTPDPWPGGLDVDADLTDYARERAGKRLAEAAEIARAAVEADDAGDPDAAHWGWRQIFGPRYPEAGVKPRAAAKLSPFGAAAVIARQGMISATSAGLIAPAAAYASTRSGTSHGGDWEPGDPDPASGPDSMPRGELERQIAEVLAQFTGLRRMTPAEAAADPELWPVNADTSDTLYTVLVGVQGTNLGRRHRILVAVPVDAPIAESKLYAVDYQPAYRNDGAGRYRPARGIRHRWKRHSLCTHAACDRWDARLVTLVIWGAEWLFRQDFFQRYGYWPGAEIGGDGRRRLNPLHGGRVRSGRRK